MNIGMITKKHAAISPSKIAIIDHTSHRRISFGELEDHVLRLANALENMGARKGDRIAILSQNCMEFMALYLACGRCGFIALPLNWRLAAPELEKIIVDGEPRVLIYHQKFIETAGILKKSTLSIKSWLEFGAGSSRSYEICLEKAPATFNTQWESTGDQDPLYILYTGGTTGASKGVLHSHSSTFCAMMNNTAVEGIQPTDVYMLTGQMFHSPVVMAITYLSHGCPVVLTNFEPKSALELIQNERVTAFIGITTMLNWMMAVENFEQYDLSSLRHVKYGGGPLPASVVKEAMEKFNCDLIGIYGQTEGIAMSFLTTEDHRNAIANNNLERLNSCGREAYLTTISIIDEDGNEIPKDYQTSGEVIIKSPANMLGYWKNPELTEKTIIDGWMRTGDIGKWDSEGFIYLIDRAKDMIISGGENIYSIQVEEAIYKHPAVLETAVIGIPDMEWGELVKAYVVLKPNTTANSDDIINIAKSHLASYQKPRIIEFVESLPKAPTGKILKRILRDKYWSEKDKSV
jgi:acyl-CoA synthetase (AMP-forming)/AMP-acid ligase II